MRLLWRDARSGELNLLFAAMVVAVLIVTSIALFAERLQGAMVSEAEVFLAANLVLQSSAPVTEDLRPSSRTANLRQAELVQFPSMVSAGDTLYLASIKAASDNYPLLGKLEVSDEPVGNGVAVEGGPRPGEAWIDNRLLHLLNVHQGSRITLGERTFVVGKILVREPDSGSSYWSLAPRVLISLADLPATGLVQSGSRVEYRYLFAGDEVAIDAYASWLKTQISSHQRVLTLHDSQPGLARSLDRAEHFLLLAGSLGVLLAAIAIAMAARRYCIRHYDSVAIMKTLGATPGHISQLLFFHLLVILCVGVFAGAGSGWLLHHGFLHIMADWLPTHLPPASAKPFWLGAMTGAVALFGFALPSLWPLRSIPPLRVLRRDMESRRRWPGLSYLPGILGIFGLMYLYSHDLAMTGYLVGGATVGMVAAILFAALLFGGAQRVGTQAGSAWRLALASLKRHRRQNMLQLALFGLVLMLLLVSVLVRTTLLSEWQQQLPPGTPNHFLINIARDQVKPLQQVLETQHLQTAGWYPMVRGRLVAVNGTDVTTRIADQVEEINREVNLTWSNTLPEDNRLVAGHWWDMAGGMQARTSVEKSLADKMHIRVGDELTFLLGDRRLAARVDSIRSLSWDRMRPNFFFIFSPGVLEDFPATWITSFYLPPEQKLFANQIVKQFPTVTLLAVDQMIDRIRSIVNQVTRAIELVLVLILVSGALVLLAGVQSSLDLRLRENAVLRTLGASRRLILGALCVEFAGLGLGAGLLAALGSEFTAWVLQTRVFGMDYTFHYRLWLAGPLVGGVLIGLLGVLSCRHVVQVAPVVLLREVDGSSS